MKKLLFYSLILNPYNLLGQISKFQIETSLAWSHHFSPISMAQTQDIGLVKPFYHITLRDFKIAVQKNINEKFSVGLSFFNQEFTYGYTPSNKGITGGFSIATGMTWSHYYTRTIQYNIESYIRRHIFKNVKNKCYYQAGFSIGYLPYSNIYNDTNYKFPTELIGHNQSERESISSTKFIKFPPFQGNPLTVHFLIGLGYEHKINNKYGYSFSLHYKQGFKPIFIDDTQIWVDYFTNPKSRHYYTTIKGTGLLLNYTFIYHFKNKVEY